MGEIILSIDHHAVGSQLKVLEAPDISIIDPAVLENLDPSMAFFDGKQIGLLTNEGDFLYRITGVDDRGRYEVARVF